MSLNDLIRKVIKSIPEEEKAYQAYKRMFDEAKDLREYKVADIIEEIYKDEEDHKQKLEKILRDLQAVPGSEGRAWPEELAWREKSGFGELHRPFPETYGDWVNLAQDIKANSVEAGWDIVNFYLNIVLGNDEGDVDDAKRWLVNKAGELGIT
jgi:rubrerythrin